MVDVGYGAWVLLHFAIYNLRGFGVFLTTSTLSVIEV